jgi:F-type H+-transporting ATPase subunit delta
MTDRKLANRYAEALFRAARDAGAVDRVGEEFAQLERAIVSTPELHMLLSHPEISVERKMAVVQEVFGNSFLATVFLFLRLLLKGQRLVLLSAIAEQYQELTNRWRGIVPGEVRTVIPLTDGQRTRLEAALNRLVSGRVVLKNRIDPEILGGVVVRLSDRIIDGSVRHRLARLRATLVHSEGLRDAD